MEKKQQKRVSLKTDKIMGKKTTEKECHLKPKKSQRNKKIAQLQDRSKLQKGALMLHNNKDKFLYFQ